MRLSALIVPTLGAITLAAPTYPELNVQPAQPNGVQCLSDYFNLLAQKVETFKHLASPPSCDIKRARLPIAPQPLPEPSKGLTLKHVAIGRGTQNYTCDTTNSTAVPKAAGALAILYNANCVAATLPDLLDLLPAVSLQFNLTSLKEDDHPRMGPSDIALSGVHYFTNATTPFFNLNPGGNVGEIPVSLNTSTPAPVTAASGQQGEKAVGWLKLLAREGATGDLQEVYRVHTAGGSAPASCSGMPASFEVQYAAQYWFFEGKIEKVGEL